HPHHSIACQRKYDYRIRYRAYRNCAGQTATCLAYHYWTHPCRGRYWRSARRLKCEFASEAFELWAGHHRYFVDLDAAVATVCCCAKRIDTGWIDGRLRRRAINL